MYAQRPDPTGRAAAPPVTGPAGAGAAGPVTGDPAGGVRAGGGRRVALLDSAVVVGGLLLVLQAVLGAVSGPRPADWEPVLIELALAVPLSALLSSRSLRLSRSGGAVHVATDSAVLVLLATTVPSALALLGWLAGVTLAQLLARGRTRAARAFNVGLSALAGSVLLLVVTALDVDLSRFGVRELLALVIGTAGYLAVDLVLTGVSVAWAERHSVVETLADESAPVAALAVLAVNGVGLLAALLAIATPWAVVLLVPVLLAPVYAAHASSVANTERLRTAALFDAAAATQAADSRAQLEASVTRAASRLTAAPGAALTPTEPPPGRLAVRVGPEHDPYWLVVHDRHAGNAFSPQDVTALQVLGALTSQALDRLELLQAMSRAASSDALTGLANRREAERVLAAAVDEVEAHGPAPGGRRPGIVYIDLNGFKAVNDTYGHGVGDELLVAVAKRLAASVREQDVVSRWGGDEFVVLLRDTDEEQAHSAADRLCAAVAGIVSLRGAVVVQVTASAGVALHQPGGTPQALLAAADAAMYAIKHAGD